MLGELTYITTLRLYPNYNQETYPSYNVTAQVLQVVDDVAVSLYVCMLDELGKVLLPNAYMDNKMLRSRITLDLCYSLHMHKTAVFKMLYYLNQKEL